MQYSLTSFGDKEQGKMLKCTNIKAMYMKGVNKLIYFATFLCITSWNPPEMKLGPAQVSKSMCCKSTRILSIASRLSSNSHAMSGLLMVVLLFLYLCLSKDCSYSAPLLGC